MSSLVGELFEKGIILLVICTNVYNESTVRNSVSVRRFISERILVEFVIGIRHLTLLSELDLGSFRSNLTLILYEGRIEV